MPAGDENTTCQTTTKLPPASWAIAGTRWKVEAALTRNTEPTRAAVALKRCATTLSRPAVGGWLVSQATTKVLAGPHETAGWDSEDLGWATTTTPAIGMPFGVKRRIETPMRLGSNGLISSSLDQTMTERPAVSMQAPGRVPSTRPVALTSVGAVSAAPVGP